MCFFFTRARVSKGEKSVACWLLLYIHIRIIERQLIKLYKGP